jgi:hypothetical protein
VVTAACGKKGPPLAPFVRVPATVANVTAQRVGGDIYLSFPVPSTNVDGQQPADIALLEVYAVTSTRPPATEDQREVATLVASVPVRPILPEIPVPANGSPPPPVPLPPGVERGSTAVVREPVTADTLAPVTLPEQQARSEDTEEETEGTEAEAFGPLVAPPPAELPRRHYFVVGVSPRGRKSDPSTPLSVALETGSSAPGPPTIEYTESQMTVTWTPPPDARTSTFLLPPSASAREESGEPRRDLAGAASGREGGPVKPTNASSKNVTPAKPPLAPLPAKSLGFSQEATTYNLYAVAPAESAAPAAPVALAAPVAPAAPDPYAVTVPKPLTPQPLLVTEHVIPNVTFGVEQCFEVRSVDVIAGAQVLSPAAPPACITPKDTFAPAPPRALAAIAGSGVINLIWDAGAERDLAGYIVLRGDAPGDTLRPITTEPVEAATYRDETARPATRYVYAVAAVDRAGNRSELSNRVEETAR